jgi:endonuclease/exonuclease/phosphatase family metal-dependent hydrolase
MKALIFLFLILPTIIFTQNIRIMSYNIRYDNPSDGPNSWSFRKHELIEQIERIHPSILGIQESLYHQTEYIDSCLQKYTYTGVGREDGLTKGEFGAIFYDSTKFKLVSSDTFWLSETPKSPSVGWDAALERICTYALFENKVSSNQIWVFNLHLDHIGMKSQKNSVNLILKTINAFAIANTAIVITGDFNCIPKSTPIKIMSKNFDDSFKTAKTVKIKYKGTFNNFDKNLIPESRIDYVFVKNADVIKYEHKYENRLDGYFYSDHLPIVVDISILDN